MKKLYSVYVLLSCMSVTMYASDNVVPVSTTFRGLLLVSAIQSLAQVGIVPTASLSAEEQKRANRQALMKHIEDSNTGIGKQFYTSKNFHVRATSQRASKGCHSLDIHRQNIR